jgi:hypothetical protein
MAGDPLKEMFESVWGQYADAGKHVAKEYKSVVKKNRGGGSSGTDSFGSDGYKEPQAYRLGVVDLITRTARYAFDLNQYEERLSQVRLIISTAYSMYVGYKLWQYNHSIYSIVFSLLASLGVSAVVKAQYIRDRINMLNYSMFKNGLKDSIRFVDFEIHNGQGKASAKTSLPLSQINKEVLEVAFNATITSVKNVGQSKKRIIVEFDKSKSYIYGEIPKEDIANRLDAILHFYKSKPKFISAAETEIATTYKFFTQLPNKKLLRLIPDIEHKLALKKGSLELSLEDGYAVFNIRKEQIKQIWIDDLVREIKRPATGMPFVVGINRATNIPVIFDLHKIQHMLIGGKTGIGKSSLYHALIAFLMYWNDDIIFSMFDLKGSELRRYSDFANCQVCTILDGDGGLEDTVANHILPMLESVYADFRKRLKLFRDANVPDLESYINKTGHIIPTHIVLIDEVNTIKTAIEKSVDKETFKKIKMIIDTLFQQSRSVGIYLWIAGQTITDVNLPIFWRQQCMTKLCMKMAEKIQTSRVLEGLGEEYFQKAIKQRKGEYIILDEDMEVKELKNVRVMKLPLKDLVFEKIEKKYGKGSNHESVFEENPKIDYSEMEDVEETEDEIDEAVN